MKKILMNFCILSLLFGCSQPSHEKKEVVTEEKQEVQNNDKKTVTQNHTTVNNKKDTEIKKDKKVKNQQKTQDTKKTTEPKKGVKKESKKQDKKEEKKEQKKEEKQYCSLTVSCSSLINHKDLLESNYQIPSQGLIYSQQVQIEEGDSVLSILRKSGLRVDASGGYVKGIDNLYEFDCGNESGWTYSVNGRKLSVGASQYKVKKNDKIKWMYTVKRNEW
jgi:hypothetical protein